VSGAVWERIEESRARHNVLEHPFYVRWSAGELSRDELARYAGQYRHATEALARLCRQTAETAPEERRDEIATHAEEEEAHVGLWDDFVDAAGGEIGAEPTPETAECVSEWTAQQIQDGHDLAEDLGIHLISNQPQYSMLWRVIESDVVPVCVSVGMSQIVFSPIAQGVLTGKYRPGEQPPSGSRATDDKGGADTIKRWMRDDVLDRVQQLAPLAEEAGLSMAQLAVAWVLQNDNVASAIVGASRPEQVHDNAAAAGVKLSEELLAKIDKVLDPVVERDPAKTLESSPESR